MKISTSSAPYMPAGVMAKNADGRIYAMLLAIPTFGLLGIFVLGAPREYPSSGKRWVRYLLGSVVLLIVTSCLLAAGGCGGGSSSAGTGTQRGKTTVMITGTSGNLSHSASVALTVQ
jgi:hypothetical protein